jgi:hypothetical protein
MNTENLLKAAAYIRTVPQSKFDMDIWRGTDKNKPQHECKSIGCVIGHCTILDPNIKKAVKKYSLGLSFDYYDWATDFFTLEYDQWEWCFSYVWKNSDNTPEGAALRIEWLINHGLPDNWEKQMNGEAELCYTKKS